MSPGPQLMFPARNNLRIGRVVLFVVDESPLWAWIAAFSIMVVTFGILYALLSPFGHGVAQTQGNANQVDLIRGLYFSVVTVSSLGYGDIHPIGIGKLLAGMEVLLGLGFIGIMIAKLTSKPLTYLVSRLFVSDTKRQLNNYRANFEACRTDLETLLANINRVYQQTPGRVPPDRSESRSVALSFKNSLDKVSQSSLDFHDYIRAEGLHTSYFRLAPKSSFLQLSKAVEAVFFLLGQNIIVLPFSSNPDVRQDIFTFANRREIHSIIRTQKATCQMIVGGVRIDENIQKYFRNIESLCTNISDLLLPIPDKPDQLIQSGDKG